jgi:1-acyl-sn-glycerol-3-phosphate acyltransferase
LSALKTLVALLRLLRLVLHLAQGLWIIRVVFPRLSADQRDARVQAWALQTLSHLGLKVSILGTPPKSGPVLLVANHISWADIVVMHAARHCRFVAKADVGKWPVVGTLATAAGTLYVARESRKDAMRVVHRMVECLGQDEVLAVFPEGTTGNGATLLPFHGNMLQAAITADAPVQPVALSFLDLASGTQSFAPCYIGNDTLVGSLWRTLRADALVAIVHYGEIQTAEGRDRRTWSADLRSTIETLRSQPVTGS